MTALDGFRRKVTWAIGGRSSFRSKVATTLLVQFGGLALAVVQGAIVARWLGPAGKGVLTIVLLVPALLGMFLNPGLAPSYTYLIASRRTSVHGLGGHALVFAAVAGVLAYALVGIGSILGVTQRLLPGVPAGTLLLALVGVPVTLFGGQLGAILLGQERIHRMNLIALAGAAAALAFTTVTLVVLRWGVPGAVAATVGSGILMTVLYWRAARLGRGGLRLCLDFSLLRPMFSYGIRAHVGNLMQFFNYRLDSLILNYIVGPAAVGIYAVSVRLAELVWLVPGAVGTVIFPRAAARTPEEMNRFTPRVFRWTLAFALIAGAGIMLLGRIAIKLVYSAAFLDAYAPLLLLLPGTILLGGAKVLTNDLAGRGRPQYNAIASGVALVLTVHLDLLLIPSHGAAGAAVASSVSYAASFALAVAFWMRTRARLH